MGLVYMGSQGFSHFFFFCFFFRFSSLFFAFSSLFFVFLSSSSLFFAFSLRTRANDCNLLGNREGGNRALVMGF